MSQFFANQILYQFLEEYNLPLEAIDKPIFQELLKMIRLAGNDYHPSSEKLKEDNHIGMMLKIQSSDQI